MTSAEALRILAAPKFGNLAHIAAVKHLEDVALAREARAKCRHKKCLDCDGRGKIGRGRDACVCDFCDGSGKDSACRCFVGLRVDAILEARGK